MFKRIVLTASAVALATGGLVAGGVGAAGAAKPLITAGPGSSVDCSITALAKVKGPLRDNWIAADHQTDPNAAVRALPDTLFAPPGPVAIKAKANSVSCTGTLTDGVNTATVASAKINLVNNLSFPGSTDPATCAGLIAPDPLNPSTARYDATIKWKATGAKVADTTITAAEITSGGAFEISGGTISGSFAGGTSSTSANPDLATLGQFLSSTEIQPGAVTSSTPEAGGPCQPSLKLGQKKGVDTAKLKKGKGIKKLTLDTGTFSISR